MKRFLITILVILFFTPFNASAQSADSTNVQSVGHLMFHGVPMEGTIEHFSDAIRKHFQLKRMMGAERNWIFQGFIYGKECPMQVFYTKKTRQVCRIIVMPKNIDNNAWLDSLTTDYGEPIEIELGYAWQSPQGTILLRVIEGYDPALIYLDKIGQAIYNEEENKRR